MQEIDLMIKIREKKEHKKVMVLKSGQARME